MPTPQAGSPDEQPGRAYTESPWRTLRVFAHDPSLATQLENYDVSDVLVRVRWEPEWKVNADGTKEHCFGAGPAGEYIEVVDVDPASNCAYDPVDLNDSHLLAQNGLPPSEGHPQFHQQMVYAVAMTTIEHFERALGREVLWAEIQVEGDGDQLRQLPVRRLRIYPHALREENAYYDPDKKALLFGYFPAHPELEGTEMPGGIIFTCLSHDIIAHETTHAILDGMQRYFLEPSNVDALAFHEAFADTVALFQHFTYPEILRRQLQRARGDLEAETLLGQLAVQFGQATGGRGALRDAIGEWDRTANRWKRRQPNPDALASETEPHRRGALLVAAVFDAFLAIYRRRTADLLRIGSGGTGILPEGDLHPDLVNRLAHEAAKAAQHVLLMCIRAIDYCPPVDVTFGDYLRALVTADFDLVPDDDRKYRVAFIEAFRKWGIYPRDVRTLSEESLRWRPPEGDGTEAFAEMLRPAFYADHLARVWDEIVNGRVVHPSSLSPAEKLDRMALDARLREFRAGFHAQIEQQARHLVAQGRLGGQKRPFGFNLDYGTPADRSFEVHQVRPLYRIGPDGRTRSDLLIQITQQRPAFFDEARQREENARYLKQNQNAPPPKDFDFCYRGGATFILELETFKIRYAIQKDIVKTARLDRQREFLGASVGTSLRELYFGRLAGADRLAELHGCVL